MSTPKTGTRILVIDDEVDLLDYMTRALRGEGYLVDAVSDADQALARLAETRYELIICDMRMPGLSGPQLYRQAQAQDPDLAERFMFVTGDTIGHATQDFLAETGAPFLCKPFGLAELIDQLHGLLESPTNGV
jgi:CheY-like chemotaxis protein